MFLLLLLILGLFIGSFLNVLIDRLPNEQSVVYPPSHCDFCKKKLLWYDLIPLVSFALLRGRCRYCHLPISIRYPIVEVLTGFLFVAVFVTSPLGSHFVTPQGWPDRLPWGGFWELLFALVILSSFIVIFFADLKYGIIPDKITFPAIGISFLYLVLATNFTSGESLRNTPEVGNALLSAGGAFFFFLAIYLVTRGRGMGFGDVKLAFLLGLFFGFPKIVYVLYIAFLTGAIFSIILIILRRKRLKETIVFGPFLVVGSLFVFFFWDKLRTLWILPGVLP